jgi:hypothetical protein
MTVTSIDFLSEELLEEFGNRKKPGRLDLVYDASSDVFYPVPTNQEHSDFMPQLEGDPRALIPVQLRMNRENDKWIVRKLLVGASSFESETYVRHPQAYLKAAYDQTLILLARQPDFENRPEQFQISKRFVEY